MSRETFTDFVKKVYPPKSPTRGGGAAPPRCHCSCSCDGLGRPAVDAARGSCKSHPSRRAPSQVGHPPGASSAGGRPDIDDCQAVVSQRRRPADPSPLVVRTVVRYGGRHIGKLPSRIGTSEVWIEVDPFTDAAQVMSPHLGEADIRPVGNHRGKVTDLAQLRSASDIVGHRTAPRFAA